jgi:hypothetical protein
MKKKLGLLALGGVVITAVVLLAANTVYAKGVADLPNPGEMPGSGSVKMGDAGLLHDEIVSALASVLGLSKTDLKTRLKAGEKLEDIAFKQGITKADWPAKVKAAITVVIKTALANGKITQAQADMLLKRLENNGNPDMRFGNGTPPPMSGTPPPTPNGLRPTPNPQTPPPNQPNGKPPVGPGGQGQTGSGDQGNKRPGDNKPDDIFGGLF